MGVVLHRIPFGVFTEAKCYEQDGGLYLQVPETRNLSLRPFLNHLTLNVIEI